MPQRPSSKRSRSPRCPRPKRPRTPPLRRSHARRTGRAFAPQAKPLLHKLMQTLEQLSPDLRRWLVLNLALVTFAVMQLWKGARSGYGGLTLSAVSRLLPLELKEKMRAKRLWRLLANQHLCAEELTPLLIRLALGPNPRGWIPLVVDQTDIRGIQVIMVGIRVAHRTIPVAFTTFTYDQIPKSQNRIESALLKLVAAHLPAGCKPLFVMDRGYARVSLLRELNVLGIPFLVRGRRKTTVHYQSKRFPLRKLRFSPYRARRYAEVLYQGDVREAVDVVTYSEPDFKEPWFLLVPPGCKDRLPTDEVVALYRDRMHIELTFRDWKTHLGVRGLRLEVDVAPRLGRLLLVTSVAYALTVLLGASSAAPQVRRDHEILRSKPRHGTRHRLGALMIGILLLSVLRYARLLERTLFRVLDALIRGIPAVRIAVCPPAA